MEAGIIAVVGALVGIIGFIGGTNYQRKQATNLLGSAEDARLRSRLATRP